MLLHAAILFTKTAGVSMRAYVSPILLTLEGLASLSSVFSFVNGGILYMTSSGKPEMLIRRSRCNLYY
jgi:hypothetical protein